MLEEAYGRGGDSSQDGLLTALELQTLDLQGSDMLVLSQCLAYFSPVIEEVLRLQVGPEYFRHLRSRISRLTPA